MQINPLLYSDSTVVFVGDDGRLRNVNLTSGLSQRMGGNLSFVSKFRGGLRTVNLGLKSFLMYSSMIMCNGNVSVQRGKLCFPFILSLKLFPADKN